MMQYNVGNFTQSNNIVVHLSSTLIQVGIFVVSYMIIVYKKLLLQSNKIAKHYYQTFKFHTFNYWISIMAVVEWEWLSKTESKEVERSVSGPDYLHFH